MKSPSTPRELREAPPLDPGLWPGPSTPPGWEVRYWDENLLQGLPPHEPFPQVVGITVHLAMSILYKRANPLCRLVIPSSPS